MNGDLHTIKTTSNVAFFIPGIESPESAEKIYEERRKVYGALESSLRIRSLAYWDRNLRKDLQLAVGKPEPWFRQRVKIILDQGESYLVLTDKRGLLTASDFPMMVGKREARQIEYFKPSAPNK